MSTPKCKPAPAKEPRASGVVSPQKPRGPGRRPISHALLLPELRRLLGPEGGAPPWVSSKTRAALVRAHNHLLHDVHRARAAHPSLHALARALGVSDTTVDGWVASGLIPPAD